ncbi:ABC transporter permease [Lacicoccus qingdaonensis]|uniref:Glycine betaine/proline transport system permease protein/glycine betaine/proline transport system substrate-binding protein n=1 Tax=Lacicoccus qingdaonensis TaxID=576118 RepID=A0A1G9FXE1_9BACL|nr:proline/glycine betaine ABC transporter permease [Salinicoccus qingdaonensis]SDK93037.1 glycine betaine/proline transport system permease protein/glycine betaine/proline transport system substrate-binding protein [Salinicoccus qingdaonensis]
MLDNIPRLPLSEWTSDFVRWLTSAFNFIFDPINNYLGTLMNWIIAGLEFIPPVLFILIVMALSAIFMKKKVLSPILIGIGLLFIYNQGLWENLIDTMTLVIIAGLISIIIGVPLGILMSRSNTFEMIIKPILDLMQTMPAFVYLIPAVAFFGIGMVPGVFASVIFASPPTIRLTNLGIRQISEELIEASNSFGTTPMQKLLKVQLPLARPSIMAGINQTIMLALSMVVIASMIGAPGLGTEVLSSLQRAQVGPGFVAGLGIVILAIIIDRFTQTSNSNK